MKKTTRLQPPRRKHISTQPKVSRDVLPINPDFFYRLIEGPKYFGYQLTTQDEKIRTGEIPAPVKLSDTGRACGWFGRAILDWQKSREVHAEKLLPPVPRRKHRRLEDVAS